MAEMKLLPCPFCDNAARAVERDNPMSKWRWSVDCVSATCGMSGPVEATKSEAVEAWNRRVYPSEMLEALKIARGWMIQTEAAVSQVDAAIAKAEGRS